VQHIPKPAQLQSDRHKSCWRPGLVCSAALILNAIAEQMTKLAAGLGITRSWPNPRARVNGALQLSKGLAKILS
jgi:hypothetical protein